MKGAHRREGATELEQMNNLYRIPGIVCQGDDGLSVSKPKQTEKENTHTASQERSRRLLQPGRYTLYFDMQAGVAAEFY